MGPLGAEGATPIAVTKGPLPMESKTTPEAESRTVVFLTTREHHYLWLMAQGYTPREAQTVLGTRCTPSLSTRVRDKLSAQTMEQAVYLACQLDLLGPNVECGSLRGYRLHRGRTEDACRACLRAFQEYCLRNDTVTIRRVVLTEAETRLLRAFDSGRTPRQIARNWNVTEGAVARLRTSVYRKLDVAHLPQGHRMQAALEEGRRLGVLIPKAVPNPVFKRNPRRWGTTDLTELETRTLAVLARGCSLAEAGRELGGIPGSSVSSRLAIIYRKMDVLDHGHGGRREAAIKEARNRGYPV